MMGQRDHRQRIVDVVPARQQWPDPAQCCPGVLHVERVVTALKRDVSRPPRQSLSTAEGLHLGGNPARDRPTALVLPIQHHQTVGRHAARECRKCRANRVQVLVAVEMVFLDVQNRGPPWPQIQERAIEFAGFGDEMRPVADAAAAAELPDGSPHDKARVQAGPPQHEREPRRGRALPMRPADADAVVVRHHGAEQFGVLDHVDPPPARLKQFRMIARDRRRRDHQVCVLGHGLGALQRGNPRSAFNEPRQLGRRAHIRSADPGAAAQQQPGQRGHAAAAHTDHVDVQLFELVRNNVRSQNARDFAKPLLGSSSPPKFHIRVWTRGVRGSPAPARNDPIPGT